MEIVYFTVIAIGLYFAADALLDWVERRRGRRFENRQVVFFAIILPLALLTFWLLRLFSDRP
jgi:predicted PurR-regulated permease PerM